MNTKASGPGNKKHHIKNKLLLVITDGIGLNHLVMGAAMIRGAAHKLAMDAAANTTYTYKLDSGSHSNNSLALFIHG